MQVALRVASLAASLGLNTSLSRVELGGWSWGEEGSGLAAPFLALGPAIAGTVPGGAPGGSVVSGLTKGLGLGVTEALSCVQVGGQGRK